MIAEPRSCHPFQLDSVELYIIVVIWMLSLITLSY